MLTISFSKVVLQKICRERFVKSYRMTAAWQHLSDVGEYFQYDWRYNIQGTVCCSVESCWTLSNSFLPRVGCLGVRQDCTVCPPTWTRVVTTVQATGSPHGNSVQRLTAPNPSGPGGSTNSEPARLDLLQGKPPAREDSLAQSNTGGKNKNQTKEHRASSVLTHIQTAKPKAPAHQWMEAAFCSPAIPNPSTFAPFPGIADASPLFFSCRSLKKRGESRGGRGRGKRGSSQLCSLLVY